MTSHKKKIFIIILLFFAVSFLIEFFIVLPTLQDIKKINSDIQNERESLEIKFQQGQFIKSMLSEYKTIEPRKQELDQAFIKDGAELGFVTELEQIAQKYNLDPSFNKLDDKNIKENKKDPFVNMPLSIKLDGDFNQLLLFLSGIESLPYYFNISQISMSAANKQKNISTTLTGMAFIKVHAQNTSYDKVK